MALSPTEAAARSPAVALTDEYDQKVVDSAEQAIDTYLATDWDGSPAIISSSPPMSIKAVYALARRYESRGWIMQFQQQNGMVAPAAQLAANGQPMRYKIVLTPRWWLDGN